MNKKLVLSLITAVIIVCALAAVALSLNPPAQRAPTGELDFTITGSSDCLRFLNASVPTVYVPFTVAANENMQLTVNCSKIQGGANGWTDVYIYKGYWDEGADNICKASDLYPIIEEIESADFAIKLNKPYIQTFGESTQQCYTVFFVLPPGESEFHVTLKSATPVHQ
jgi:hypothetical protein